MVNATAHMRATFFYTCVVALGVLCGVSFVDASVVATSVAVSPTSVATSGSVTVSVTADIVGSPAASAPYAWRAIAYRIATADGASTCVNIPAHTTPGTYTESFTTQAPSSAGAYNIYITAYANADCSNAPAPAVTRTVIFTNALTTQAVTPVAVSAVSVASKVYDGTLSAGVTTSCALVGSPTGVTCSGVGTFADKNVGTNKTVTVSGITLGGPNASQYALTSTTATTTAHITKAPLTATAQSATRVYGQPNPPLAATLSGFVFGDDAVAAGLSGSASCTTSATTTTAVGTVPITCSTGTLAAQNYSVSSFVPGTLTITQAAQSVSFPVLQSAHFGDMSQTLAALASSALPVVYESRTPSVCTVNGAVVTVVGVGVCTVRASQPGDINYTAAPAVEQTFTVLPAGTTTTVACPASVVYDGAAQTPCTATTTGPGLAQSTPVAYTTNTHAGTAAASATFIGSATYTGSSASSSFAIAPLPVTIALGSATKVYGVADDPLAYTVSPALLPGDSISGSPVRAVGEDVGTYAVTSGTLALSSDYAPAFVPGTVTITPRAQTISFTQPSDMTFGDADQAVVVSSDSGLSIAITTEDPLVCTVVAGRIHIVHAGTCRVEAAQAGDTNHEAAAPVSHTFTIARASTTTTLFCPVSVLYTGTERAPCVAEVHGAGAVAEAQVRYTDNVHVGVVDVFATYSGDLDHMMSSTSGTFNITRAGQTLSFMQPSDMVYGDVGQALAAASDVGLPVTIVSVTPAVCTAEGGVLSVHGVGACTLRAAQSGTADVAAAEPLERTITVSKKEIHVVPDTAQAKLVTKADPPLSYTTLEALASGDVLVGDLGRVAGEGVGTYAYTLGTVDAGGMYTLVLDTGPVFTITPDVTAPVIATPVDILVEATSRDGAVVTYALPNTTDDVDPPAAASCAPAPSSTFALGSTTVTCTAADAAGNTATPVTFTVTVRDTTKPTLTLVGRSAVTLVTPEVYVDDGATWADAVDGSGSVMGIGEVHADIPGVYTRTYTYTDAAGNTAEALLRTITVNDGEAPLFTNVPSDIQSEATSPAGATAMFTLPSAADAVDGDVPVVCTHASGETFPLGTTLVTCTATDTAGHTAHASWQVVVHDTTAPALTLVGEQVMTIDAGHDYVEAGATWVDAVDGAGDAGVSGVIDTAHPNTYIRTYTYTDAAGNAAQSLQRTVHVVDRAAPVLSGVPADSEVEATSSAGAVVTYTTPTAHDAIDGDIAVACVPVSGSVLARGTTHVVCTSSDTAQNSAQAQFTVTVRDTTKPRVMLVGPATVELYVGDTYTDAGATWSDAVDGAGSAAASVLPDTARSGSTLILYTYTDAAGNAGDAVTRTVVVRDQPGGGGVAGTTYTFTSPSAPTSPLPATVAQPPASQIPSQLPTSALPTTPTVETQAPAPQTVAVAGPAPASLPGVVLGASIAPPDTAPEQAGVPHIAEAEPTVPEVAPNTDSLQQITTTDVATQQAAAGMSIPTSWSLSALASVLLVISAAAFVKSFEKPPQNT